MDESRYIHRHCWRYCRSGYPLPSEFGGYGDQKTLGHTSGGVGVRIALSASDVPLLGLRSPQRIRTSKGRAMRGKNRKSGKEIVPEVRHFSNRNASGGRAGVLNLSLIHISEPTR